MKGQEGAVVDWFNTAPGTKTTSGEFALKGQEGAIVDRFNTGTVSKTTPGDTSDRRDGARMGLPEHVDTVLLNSNELATIYKIHISLYLSPVAFLSVSCFFSGSSDCDLQAN